MGPRFADGSVTVLFRRWRRSQVQPAHIYRTAAGRLCVESVDVVRPDRITTADARRAGYRSVVDVLADLRGDPDWPVYRLRVHPAPDPDPRAELAAEDRLDPEQVAQLSARLARLDRASTHGAWTAQTLRLIAERPAVRAGDLAASVGREMLPFKVDVRKLKNLGLTLSLEVGYQLSPRGAAYLVAQDMAQERPS
jgi:hypothetical protein